MTEHILEVDDLCKSFGAVQANKRINLSVKAGEVHALIGPNGAGKTTLVNLLSGELLPDSGAIVFNGELITRLKPYSRASRGLTRSFQITSIFEHMSVEENMALSIISLDGHNFKFWKNVFDDSVVKKELIPALERVDLADRRKMLARQLSHGEKRQLEVGMALVGNPKLLILDEPMAGMGPGGTVQMSRLINQLRGSMTILLVEHDMEVVFSLANTITVLVYGESIAHGAPREIRENKAVRLAYLGEE